MESSHSVNSNPFTKIENCCAMLNLYIEESIHSSRADSKTINKIKNCVSRQLKANEIVFNNAQNQKTNHNETYRLCFEINDLLQTLKFSAR